MAGVYCIIATVRSSARVVVGKVGATEPVEDSDLLSASVDVGTDKPVRVVSDLLLSLIHI